MFLYLSLEPSLDPSLEPSLEPSLDLHWSLHWSTGLFTALRLDISSDCMHSSTPPTIPVKHTTAVAELGEVVNFVHKVKVRSEITPVQQKLRRLPFSIRDEGTAELLRLEKEGIIERADSSFNYTIEYKRGCDNVIADCLSRLPLPNTDFNVEPDMEMVALVR